MSICVISIWGLLQILLLWIFLYRSFSEHMLTFQLGIYPRVEFLSHSVSVFLTLVDNANLTKYLHQFTPPQLLILTYTLYCQYFNFSHMVVWISIFLMTSSKVEFCLSSGSWDWKSLRWRFTRRGFVRERPVGEGRQQDWPPTTIDFSWSQGQLGSLHEPAKLSCLETKGPARPSYPRLANHWMWVVPGEEYDFG